MINQNAPNDPNSMKCHNRYTTKLQMRTSDAAEEDDACCNDEQSLSKEQQIVFIFIFVNNYVQRKYVIGDNRNKNHVNYHL